MSVHVARKISHNASLNGVAEHSAGRFVQVIIVIILHHLRVLLIIGRCKAYSICFDAAKNIEKSCPDVRLRIFAGVGIQTFICLQYRCMSHALGR